MTTLSKEITINTDEYNKFIPITAQINEVVEESNLTTGVVYAISKHTTTGITVNENLECLESDLDATLSKIAPEDGFYYHARFLQTYGAMAGNPTGHIKSMLVGNHCVFPIVEGKMVLGSAQEIYLAEFDGPQSRGITIVVMGD